MSESSTTIEQLELEVKSNSKAAQSGIDALASSLGKLKNATQGANSGLGQTSNNLKKIRSSLNGINNEKINKLAQSMRQLTNSSRTAASRGIGGLLMKVTALGYGFMRVGRTIGSCINESNKYIEDLNLFNASMGQYASEAQKYAEKVGNLMGIDPAEWMRNQGIFMTLATGFGVVGDRAYTMSKNLTQLGYDLSSFFNISYKDAMQKLQSGLAGELEPLRRIGYDLSIARLQQEALNLGISKSVNAMTQAEKAELRYYAIMTQVTVAQGDMARTLNAPANQLRILRAQVIQCARAFGNIFIPILNKVLPYAIAVAKVIRLIASTIASLFGFKLPEVDYSGLKTAADSAGDLADGADNASSGLGKAAKQAKKVKDALLGIDELNIISKPDNSASGGSGGGGSGVGGLGSGGGFDFELPEYDFLGKLANNRINKIVKKMKEWLGINKKIKTWSDLFHTRLGKILTTVGSIGLGFLAWRLSNKFLDGLGLLYKFLQGGGLAKRQMLTIGIALAVTGITLEATAIIDTIMNGLDLENLFRIISSSGVVVSGGVLIGKALGKPLLGGALGAIVAGIPAFCTGVYDAIKNGLTPLNASLIALSSTLAGAGIGALIGSIGGPLGALIGLVAGVLTDLVILVFQKGDEIEVAIDKFFKVTLPQKWDSFLNWLDSLPGKILDWFHNMWNRVLGFDWKSLGSNLGEKLSDALRNGISLAIEYLPTLLGGIPSLLLKLPELLSKELPGILPKLLKIGGSIVLGILEGIGTVATAFQQFAEGFVKGIKDSLTNSIEKSGGFGKWAKSHILDPMWKHIKKFKPIELTIKLVNNIAKLWKQFKKWWSDKTEEGTTVDVGIKLFRKAWTTVEKWVKDFLGGTVNKNIGLSKTWESVGKWIKSQKDESVTKNIGLSKTWGTVGGWIKNQKDESVYKNIGLSKTWDTVAEWVKKNIGGKVTVFIDLAKGWVGKATSKIRKWLGLENGGVATPQGIRMFANGGVIGNRIPMYANGTTSANHGSLFLAGENGAEMVGHIGGRTEVMNRFQLADVMHYSIVSGMSPFAEAMVRQMVICANKIIQAMLVCTDYTSANLAMVGGYDDTSAIAQYAYESGMRAFSTYQNESSTYEDMKLFYTECVEPSMNRVVEATETQARKKEKTIVQIGTREVTDAVTRQKKADGFSFTE